MKCKAAVILALFIALIGVPMLTTSMRGNDVSELEKRRLAPMPRFFLDDGSPNPQAMEEMTAWLDDHIGMKSALATVAGKVKINVFGQSPTDQVVIGDDGWFFYTGDFNLQIAEGTYPLSDDVLRGILINHLAIRDKLREQGIEYVVILPTSKVSIYPEYLRGIGSGEIRETPADIVADYLQANSDLRVVRLKETLLEAKKSRQVYFKTDTHWNEYGAYVAFLKLIEDMRAWGLCETDPPEVTFAEKERLGEFNGMMGAANFLPAEITPSLSIVAPSAEMDIPLFQELTAYAEGLPPLLVPTELYAYQNASVQGPKVLMFGDSMFGGWGLPELLAESFPSYTYVWNINILQEYIDMTQPDVVVYELTERFLNTFPTKNLEFLKTPLPGSQAEVLGAEWQGYTLYVTVQNTGESTWHNFNAFCCGLFADGADTGLRASVPIGAAVKPGDVFTLKFESNENVPPGELSVQMLQEGVTYFGNRFSIERPI